VAFLRKTHGSYPHTACRSVSWSNQNVIFALITARSSFHSLKTHCFLRVPCMCTCMCMPFHGQQLDTESLPVRRLNCWSNTRYVVCLLLDDSRASEFYMPTFRNTAVPKRRHIKFRRRGITEKKAYNIQDTAEVWNQEYKILQHHQSV